MRIDPRHGAVGEWYFEHPEPLVLPYGLTDYRRLLSLVQSFAEILEHHELLFARTVSFHHPQWTPHDIECNLPNSMTAAQLAYTCERLLADARSEAGGLPVTTDIAGDGFVLDPLAGVQRLAGVISMTATMYGNLAINMATQVDAWMEYTIDAKPQPEVHRMNAPRLEAALIELQRRTGIIPVTEPTRFAVPDITGLRNQRYSDGQPVDCSILLG